MGSHSAPSRLKRPSSVRVEELYPSKRLESMSVWAPAVMAILHKGTEDGGEHINMRAQLTQGWNSFAFQPLSDPSDTCGISPDSGRLHRQAQVNRISTPVHGAFAWESFGSIELHAVGPQETSHLCHPRPSHGSFCQGCCRFALRMATRRVGSSAGLFSVEIQRGYSRNCYDNSSTNML
eukprot:965102-Amphidinium_carterae.2